MLAVTTHQELPESHRLISGSLFCRTMYQRMQALVKDGTLEHTINGLSPLGRVSLPKLNSAVAAQH